MPSRLPTPDSRPPAARRGYTLVELLVVMIIMVILVATALPLVKRVMDNDRVREASRQLSSYISMANTRAMQTGRPCGLLFVLQQPLGASPAGPPYVRQCTQLYLAEAPPPYAGWKQEARGRIMPSTAHVGAYEFNPIEYNSTTSLYEPDPVERAFLIGSGPLITPGSSLINLGEQFLVQFNHKGPWYICQRGIAGDPYGYTNSDLLYYVGRTVLDGGPPRMVGFLIGNSSTPPPPGVSTSNNPGYSYTIMRSPRPVGEPLELTGSTCIDMTYSGAGVDGNGFILANATLGMVFSPSGSISGVYADGSAPAAPPGTIHLLVGRAAKMNDLLSDVDGDGLANIYDKDDSNLADATSLWVSIGRANGSVTTSENVPAPSFNTALGPLVFLAGCRSVATGREQMGGQ